MTTKLIEVALPLDAINVASAREKSIRQGHPSTLHLWWARRPLAACRAVLFASLVDDPSAHPDRFPTIEAQDAERDRLFGIIESLVRWENSNDPDVLAKARAEIAANCNGDPPAVLDPFAGGGSIPLEAQRLGLNAHASDLNPVAVIINKALIEIPARFADRQPVHPAQDCAPHWRYSGASGIAADVRYYGKWIRDEAERRIGHLYPNATLPADHGGREAKVIAWIWARTILCPNPVCGSTMPLMSSFWLSKKKNRRTWVEPRIRGNRIRFEIKSGSGQPQESPKIGRGAKFRCLCCSQVAADSYVHDEIDSGRSGQQLVSVVAEGVRQRIYLPATDDQENTALVGTPMDVPNAEARGTFGGNAQGLRYGFRVFSDYFTARQLTALTTFTDLVTEVRQNIRHDALSAGMTDDSTSLRDGGTGAMAYAEAISIYLALAVDKCADLGNSLCRWEPQAECPRQLFGRQAIPMVWDFAEGNLLGSSSGSWEVVLDGIVRTFGSHAWPAPLGDNKVAAIAEQRDAMNAGTNARCTMVSTDPPYYDNISYADLSDFFYVWMRRCVRSVFQEEFSTLLVPKRQELVAERYRFDGDRQRADEFFEDGLGIVFERLRRIQDSRFPLTIYYAFKQTETIEGDIFSTGWETMLRSLLDAGLTIQGTWPMRTEASNRMVAAGRNALASSIVLVCRPRSDSAGITDREGFVRALRKELPAPIYRLQTATIAPVDLRQAAIGPGMAVFSRYKRVVEDDGSAMTVRTALGLINRTLETVLGEQAADFDPETRWAIQWFGQHFDTAGTYGEAELLAVAMNVAVSAMVESGIVISGAGKVCLVTREEISEDWDPVSDNRTTVWEASQHLIRLLINEGEEAAGRLLRLLGGMGESCRALAYRLYTVCENDRPDLAGPYNALVAAWSEIQRQAEAAPPPEPVQQTIGA